ncbi:MAG: hypothetical protein HY547_07450 [Elusimicrobia bacterium]|nr:hypothetical protein [Elusimicrobiota bacterium]
MTTLTKRCMLPASLTMFAFTGCSIAPAKPLSLPNIPAHVLADPSGIGFNGKEIFIADWKKEGLLVIDLVSGKSNNLSTRTIPQPLSEHLRPIQAIALNSGRTLLENHDGELWIGSKNDKNPSWVRIHTELIRQPAGPICWDGIRIQLLTVNERAEAALLENNDLVAIPELNRPLGNILQESVHLSWSCAWGKFFALARKGSDFFICQEPSGQEHGCRAWVDPELEPIALTQFNRQQLIVLARERQGQGNYRLILWPKTDDSDKAHV